LYDFSADWCPPCRLLKKEVFGDKPLASEINKAFIPVQIIDRQREDGANSLETNRLQKRYKIKAFPTLVVSKIGMSDTKVQAGYKDKATVKLFIDDSLMWSYSASNSYEVKWQNLDDGIATSSESKRPLLILFWDERSITSRVDYLVNRKLANLIDQHFVPAEVELPIKPELFKTQQSKQLLAILDMKLSPALVIVPADGGTPHFQIGGTTADDNKEFLQKYLRFCEKKVNSSD
jgi:thiol-disulfide isomerase/thioredoxin